MWSFCSTKDGYILGQKAFYLNYLRIYVYIKTPLISRLIFSVLTVLLMQV